MSSALVPPYDTTLVPLRVDYVGPFASGSLQAMRQSWVVVGQKHVQENASRDIVHTADCNWKESLLFSMPGAGRFMPLAASEWSHAPLRDSIDFRCKCNVLRGTIRIESDDSRTETDSEHASFGDLERTLNRRFFDGQFQWPSRSRRKEAYAAFRREPPGTQRELDLWQTMQRLDEAPPRLLPTASSSSTSILLSPMPPFDDDDMEALHISSPVGEIPDGPHVVWVTTVAHNMHSMDAPDKRLSAPQRFQSRAERMQAERMSTFPHAERMIDNWLERAEGWERNPDMWIEREGNPDDAIASVRAEDLPQSSSDEEEEA
jgi:hypothetical protein